MSATPRALKVLIVEDNALDADLIVRELRRAGFEPECQRVETEAEFLAHLHPGLDVILSDHNLPEFTGVRAMELWKALHPDIPFILVSGAIGEETAVAAMKLGATDYLLKDRLARLGPALEQALAQSRLKVERRQAVLALEASEARYHGLLDNMLEGCQIIGFDWRYLYINETAARHGQRSHSELMGQSLLECYPAFAKSEAFAAIQECMTERKGMRIENEFVQADGKMSCFELSVQPVPEGIFILSLDVTERKQAAQHLRDSEERFRQLAENINEVFWMTEPSKQQILYVSPAYAAIWGRSCESLYEQPLNWIEAIHPDDRQRVLAAAKSKQVTGDYDEVYRIVRPDGTHRWIHDRAFPVRNDQGEVYRTVGTAEDVTDQKRAELRTAVEHDVTAVLADGAPFLDTVRRILRIICEQLGWELGDLWTMDRATKSLRCVEVWHRPGVEIRAFAQASRLLVFAPGEGLPGQVWSSKAPQWVEDVTAGQPAEPRPPTSYLGLRSALAFPIKLRNEVYGVMEFFSTEPRPPDAEMTSMFAALGTQIGQFIERQQLEDQFRQTQKMEAIGTLAGRIAHDFNNVLAAITGYAELAKMESKGNPEVLEYLQAVLEGSRRGADLVRQILAFSRQQEQTRTPVRIGSILDEALKLLRATIPSTIQFDVVMARNVPCVLADPSQIHQIAVNLVTNAAHAMRGRPGRLGVMLETIEVDPVLATLHPGLRPATYVRLAISDTGHGMDEGTLSRIFEPFFTTKSPGEGTGLGLAVVHGIMQNLGGVITVYSRPGEGARFHLYFPAHAPEGLERPTEAAEVARGRGERILVVDDETALARMAKKILEVLGYNADAMTLPAEALAAVRASPLTYDLVITDLTMPGMTGLELAAELLKVRPGLPIMLTTGYSATLTADRVRALGMRDMLLKPLAVQQLSEALQRVFAKPVSG
ncbi:response regulator [Horticoccus sp. 23ND18S-11]|uniref:response regulator n=1 Tax=Horticoccus sp. 23ND18S-11 TaxID=3391832 RepID=UPI0039C9D10C